MMQSVAAAFTAETKDTSRFPVASALISWKRDSLIGNRTFTIGVSAIGGNDVIGINVGALGGPANYRYFDESAYLTHMEFERGLNMPLGGLSKSLGKIVLDNTSGRFTPRYMGGISELGTAILPGRPLMINAGFHYNGIDNMLPQFAGMISDLPEVNMRNRTLAARFSDYMAYFENKKLDTMAMHTGYRTDQWIEDIFQKAGMSTAQYDLDLGVNFIPFALFEVGTRFSDILHQLVEAENGHLYQDEEGKFRFENRQHWSSSPHSSIQKIIYTAQVLNSEAVDASRVINVVEAQLVIRKKVPESVIFQSAFLDAIELPANSTKEVFIEFLEPALSVTTPTASGVSSYFEVYSSANGSGTDMSSSVSVTKVANFAKSAKLEFTNTSSQNGYLTYLSVTGRQAKGVKEIYVRDKSDSSITAFNEKQLLIDNQFVQDESWAQTLARMIIDDYSNPENIQRLTIRAIPDLQLGDYISWQGRYFRVWDIKTTLDAASGFVQELTLLQRSMISYFKIGISSIGGTDKISP